MLFLTECPKRQSAPTTVPISYTLSIDLAWSPKAFYNIGASRQRSASFFVATKTPNRVENFSIERPCRIPSTWWSVIKFQLWITEGIASVAPQIHWRVGYWSSIARHLINIFFWPNNIWRYHRQSSGDLEPVICEVHLLTTTETKKNIDNLTFWGHITVESSVDNDTWLLITMGGLLNKFKLFFSCRSLLEHSFPLAAANIYVESITVHYTQYRIQAKIILYDIAMSTS